MGLFVNVYTNINLCKNVDESDFTAYVIDGRWEYKIKNLVSDAGYTGKPSNVVSCAYSTHSRFREYLIQLAKVQGVLDENDQIVFGKLTKETPFYDLIDFADNEGCLDWETASRLLPDFEKYAGANNKSSRTYMSELYKSWHEGVKLAANEKGVIVFY